MIHFTLLIFVIVSELIGEDALLKWIAFRRQADESNKFFGLFQRPDVQQFVEWIESNDDDSDDEDGEDEDEDDEEK